MSCGIYLSLIDQIRNNARSLEVFRKNWGEGFERFENEVLICQEALERCDFPKILAKTKTLIKLFLKKDNLSTEYIKMKLETILDKGDIVCPK